MALVTQNFYYFDRETSERLDRIEEKLGTIIENQETFKMSFDEDVAATKAAQDAANAALDAANGKLDAIKTDIDGLMAKIAALPVAGMTPEQEQAVKDIRDAAAAIAEKATGLATKAGAVDDLNP